MNCECTSRSTCSTTKGDHSTSTVQGEGSEGVQDFQEDQHLMARIAIDEPGALQALMDLHGDSIRQSIGHLTAWSTDTDDLFQETMVRVWRNAKSYRGESPLRPWMVRIAARVCHNHARSGQRWLRMLKRFWDAQHGKTSIDATNRDDRWEQLQTAMHQLAYSDREILVLYHLEQWSTEMLMHHFQITSEAVYVRIHRARQRLRALLPSPGGITYDRT